MTILHDAPMPGTEAPTVGVLIAEVMSRLAASRVCERPRQEARDLTAAVLDVPRSWPALHPGDRVQPDVARAVRRAAERRAAGVPFAYAVGSAAFRHLVLRVDDRVLIPRQETELLVEAVLDRMRGPGGIAVDIGTGSGAIALALAQEGHFERVIATDVSRGALDVARENARRLAPLLHAPVDFRLGPFTAAVEGVRARVIVSNPPYLSYDEAPHLPRSVRDWEPPVALFSGSGGQAATIRLLREAAALLEPGGLLALEVDSRRAARALALAHADPRYHDVTVRPDLTGRERILLATRTDG